MKTTLRLTIAALVLAAFEPSAATGPLDRWEPLNPLPTANRCGPESDGTPTVIGANGWLLNKLAN